MFIVIVCIVLCIIFTLLILLPLYKNPLSNILSYPTAIRKRVETLPEYKEIIGKIKRKNILNKIIAIIFIAIVLAIISYISGARTFFNLFLTSFIIFTVVNLYDLIVLDIIIFCHSKKLMIKGTEDMTNEYKSPIHHIRGFFIGIGLGLIVALLSGVIIELYKIILR